jgi:dipeptidase E
MKLFLYSGFSENNPLDLKLNEVISTSNMPTMTLFLSNPDVFKSKYLYQYADYCKKCGFVESNICLYSRSDDDVKNLSDEYTDIKFVTIEEALTSTAICLSGGSTYYFLNALRKSNTLEKLVEYVNKGGILIGFSAGSMLMTPDISNSTIPSYDIEPNEVGDMSLQSLNLVDFYFFPHYDENEQYLKEVRMFSNEKRKTSYLCNDNSGVYVENDQCYLYGNVIKID